MQCCTSISLREKCLKTSHSLSRQVLQEITNWHTTKCKLNGNSVFTWQSYPPVTIVNTLVQFRRLKPRRKPTAATRNRSATASPPPKNPLLHCPSCNRPLPSAATSACRAGEAHLVHPLPHPGQFSVSFSELNQASKGPDEYWKSNFCKVTAGCQNDWPW